jgi:hypothetical protein
VIYFILDHLGFIQSSYVKELRDGDNQRTYERWKKESFNKMNRAKAQSKWKEKKIYL